MIPVLFIIVLGIFLIKWSDVKKVELVSNKSQEFEKAVVTEIGMQTEVGKIAGLLKSTSEKQTPLQMSLEKFGKKN